MRRYWVLAIAVAASFAVPAAADPAADAALDALNKAARAAYAGGRSQMLARTDPVVLVAFDTLILRRNGAETRVEFTPASYHRLKSVAHIALGVYGALAPAVGAAAAPWRATLSDLREKAAGVRAVLDRLEFTPTQVERQRRLLDLSLAYIDATLLTGRAERDALSAYGRSIAPLMLANADDAAKIQLDGLHAAFEPWRRQLSAEEWARLYVLVLGSKMPRDGNLQYSYFAFAMGAEAVATQRLVYTEGVTNPQAATQLLGTMVIDRSLGEAFFGDRMRMDRDLLADGAQAYLLKLFGKLGRD